MIVAPTTTTGVFTSVWLWPPTIRSIPLTREAIPLSSSRPMWDRTTTGPAPSFFTFSMSAGSTFSTGITLYPLRFPGFVA